MPQARPASLDARNAKPAGGFALASATSIPVTLPARNVPRPPAPIGDASELSAARAEMKASITEWLSEADRAAKPDRVPTDVALAYAANAMPDQPRSTAAAAAPMGSARTAPASSGMSQIARIPPRAGQHYNDPWMRSITLATSVHYAMNVSVYGKLDVRQVRMMMIKPSSSLTLGFGGDPYAGMQTLKFAGSAVTFLPTVTFAQHHASLR